MIVETPKIFLNFKINIIYNWHPVLYIWDFTPVKILNIHHSSRKLISNSTLFNPLAYYFL